MKNAIIRTFAIVALLGFGSEMKAVRSSEAFYFSNDSISPDENIGQLSEREDSIRKSMEEAVLYICTAIFERFRTWSVCTGNYR